MLKLHCMHEWWGLATISWSIFMYSCGDDAVQWNVGKTFHGAIRVS